MASGSATRRPCHSPQGECGLKYGRSCLSLGARGHSPQGECGLKSVVLVLFDTTAGHSPQGECGLKYEPSAGALAGPCRSPHGERGLKSYLVGLRITHVDGSLSSRRAWIEINRCRRSSNAPAVTPRKGSVD